MTRTILIPLIFAIGCASTDKPYANDPLVHKQRIANGDPRLTQPMPEWKPPQPPSPPIETLPPPMKY